MTWWSSLDNHQKQNHYHRYHQLVFRAKLTQHTAFERADNTEPAAVTALALSKYDHHHRDIEDDLDDHVYNEDHDGNIEPAAVTALALSKYDQHHHDGDSEDGHDDHGYNEDHICYI